MAAHPTTEPFAPDFARSIRNLFSSAPRVRSRTVGGRGQTIKEADGYGWPRWSGRRAFGAARLLPSTIAKTDWSGSVTHSSHVPPTVA